MRLSLWWTRNYILDENGPVLTSPGLKNSLKMMWGLRQAGSRAFGTNPEDALVEPVRRSAEGEEYLLSEAIVGII